MDEFLSETIIEGYQISFMPTSVRRDGDKENVKILMRFKNYEDIRPLHYDSFKDAEDKTYMLFRILTDMKDGIEARYENRRQNEMRYKRSRL